MKTFLVTAIALVGLGSNASAADQPAARAAPVVKAAAPVKFSWTGCYVGVSGGGNWGDSEQIARSGNTAGTTITGNFRLKGSIAGGALGCDYQIEQTVIGFENDASWTDQHGSAPDRPPFNVRATSSTREKWIDTLRGRVGYAFDHFLLYGTGGVAFAGTGVTVSLASGSISESRTRTGLAVGVGSEWAAWLTSWGAVSLKLEYLHADFGSRQYINQPNPLPAATRDLKLTDDVVRAGINVRFNWGGAAVVTK
ncbi:outer membrane protein [Bradyrhizobium sp.]|uniref:outer membrane protein n=1 Tax=Bradyrhizobium sp. TaxID=376 RepID=UPI0025C25BD6|nr:outer membrane beta-barrel protein [Bradyrhizobium sp.]MBV8920170.1 porin family protein [Bradyrhizobium sp.]